MTDIVYLACPYTHASLTVRTSRFRWATKAAVHLCRKGYIVYSPITMTHPMDVLMNDDDATLGSEYWVNFDEAFMERCATLFILQLDGWVESKGIIREAAFFKHRNLPINYITTQEIKAEWSSRS